MSFRRSFLASLALATPAAAWAEPPTRLAQGVYEVRGGTRVDLGRERPEYSTSITLTILAGPLHALDSQQWARRLERYGIPILIRGPFPGDAIAISEEIRGRLRDVDVVGQLDPRGRLVVPGHVFRPTDVGEISEWLKGLRLYGAQGPPDGQARWGLNPMQFEGLAAATGEVVDIDLLETTTRDAVAAVAPPGYAVRYSIAAETWLDELDRRLGRLPIIAADVRRLARGTTLAFVLNKVGLGFRPERTPEGVVELVIEPLDDLETPWPIGGELNGTRRAAVAPALFTQFEGGVDDTFARVIALVERSSGLPVLADHPAIAADGIDLNELKVSIPPRRTSLSLVLRSATLPHRLTREVRVDEAGNPFVWILPSRSKR